MQKCKECGGQGKLMTLAEVADYLQIALRTAYGWVKEGKLPGFKVGNAWRFDRADIDKWVATKKRNAGQRGRKA